MNADERRMLNEIERDEAWLADVLRKSPAPECRALADIKRRVSIAVQEGVLNLEAPPALSAETTDRIKESVRQALGRPTAAGADRSPRAHGDKFVPRVSQVRGRGRYFAFVGLAAAAGLAIVLTPLLRGPDPAAPTVVTVDIGNPIDRAGDAGINAGIDAALDAFEAVLASNTDFDVERMRIEDTLEDMADALLSLDMDDRDSDFEDIEDDLDQLWTQSARPFEV